MRCHELCLDLLKALLLGFSGRDRPEEVRPVEQFLSALAWLDVSERCANGPESGVDYVLVAVVFDNAAVDFPRREFPVQFVR